MNKTTVYLPDELKRAVTASARHRSISEAEVIRQAIADAVVTDAVPAPTAVFSSDVVLAADVHHHLATGAPAFGER